MKKVFTLLMVLLLIRINACKNKSDEDEAKPGFNGVEAGNYGYETFDPKASNSN